MTRYFFVVLLMGLVGIAIVVKGAMIMFAERQYWHDVADRFVKENVTVKPNRGNILSSDGKLMASSLPEYKIYMDFMSGERDEKRRKKDQQRKDSIWKANFDSICIGLHQIFPDISAATFKSHLRKGREMKSRNYNILPNRNRRISYIQYKEAKRLPVFKMNKYRGGFHEQIYNQRKKPFGSLAAQTLGRLYADTAMGARNGIELAFDTLLKGRNGITHRQKVMNKYLNIVDLPPVDGCDIISTLDVGMQDICEKALVDKQKQLLEMLSLVDDAEKVLTSKTDLNEFGRLLDYTWKLKRGISNRISTDSIDGLYAKGMAAGALGGKLLGAGGGGFLLFYVEPDKQEAVHKAMEELLYVPFEFENSGTRVIHYTPETYEKR